MEKTKQQISKYVSERGKNAFVGIYKRWGKEWIYFQDKETHYFKGVIEKTKDSVNATKNLGFKFKIKFRTVKDNKKRTVIYNIYNNKQKKWILYGMNKKLRSPQQRRRYNEKVGYRKDTLPILGEKKKVDLLFDKYKNEEVKIEEFRGFS